MMKKFLLCPQCGIRRFNIKNKNGETRIVNVSLDYKLEPVNPAETLEGFDENELFCLGCSWSGSMKKLIRFFKS